jgi:mono/diheme cytochrome c family protein
MKRLLRWFVTGVGILVALVAVGYAVVYVISERVLARHYDVPAVALVIPSDPASIAEGRRLSVLRGCFGGCHGKGAEGAVLFDEPLIARLVAPNLTRAVRKYGDAELATIIRHGLRPDGRSVVVMPSEEFTVLTDADLSRIVAYLKSLPVADGPDAEIRLGPLGRIGVAFGQYQTAAQIIAEAAPPPDTEQPQAAAGRYLARTTCAHCHGTDLRGSSNPDFTAPALQIVAAYSPEAFRQFLRTGVALGGRELRVMSGVARKQLHDLTDDEIAALYSYLHAIPYGTEH